MMVAKYPGQVAPQRSSEATVGSNEYGTNVDCRTTCIFQTIQNTGFLSFPSLGRKIKPWDQSPLPLTSVERCSASLSDTTIDINEYRPQDDGSSETILYLAYGSNLSAETFRGKRGIKPISATSVAVPSLRMTFDLPGIPYVEPCFANTGMRNTSSSSPRNYKASEKTSLLQSTPDYHKDRWHKPLIGVVYELTPTDFYHVIATEGGGSSYRDILVPCHPLHLSAPTVPDTPTTPPLMAHTLYAPAIPPPKDGTPPPKSHPGGRLQRPDPSYAQPSSRYLALITSGAKEHSLPSEYLTYLSNIRPYKPTTAGQRLGQFIFVSIWVPMLMFILGIQGFFVDEEGRNPEWLTQLMGAIFVAIWKSYDGFFEGMFGDGERSVSDGGREGSAGAGAGTREERREGVEKVGGRWSIKDRGWDEKRAVEDFGNIV